MAETTTTAASTNNEVFLLYGKNGWIGGKLIELLREQGKTVHLGNVRLENRESLEREIDSIAPTHVLCAAGVTGRPNVDWCEDHKEETIRTNVIGTLNLADICNQRGIHCTLYATGCIYEYDENHQLGSGIGFTEEETPNFTGSFYSKSKSLVEPLLAVFGTLLILRVRMPISDDLNPRNFITKIIKYEKVVNVPNSMTVLTDLLPVSIIMSQRRLTGIYNFCNPGVISHNEILDLYKQYVDPEYTYTNFSIDEQAKILKAARSNNELNCNKLVSALPDVEIKNIHESIHGVFQRMRVNLEREGIYPNNLPRRTQTK